MIEVVHPPGRDAERRYALDVVLSEFIGLRATTRAEPRGDVEIRVAGDPSPRSVRVADVLFALDDGQWLTASSMPRCPLARLDPGGLDGKPPTLVEPIPVLYGAPGRRGDYLERTERGMTIHVDIFGGAFFMLTRYEELVETRRDGHDRFPAAASLAGREGFLDRPLVNEYVELLAWALRSTWPELQTARRRFCLRPTHDVDWPLTQSRSVRRLARSMAADLVRRRDPRLGLDRARAHVAIGRGTLDRDLHNTFDFLMDRSDAQGVRSAFYFMTATTRPGLDGGYSLIDPWISRLLGRIHERGHEIGLHPSYETFRDPDQLRREFETLLAACERLGIHQPAWGGRQHYLRWENPTTWQAWEDAGLSYDSSVGFADRPGFRSGTCFEHPVFNLRSRRALGLRERPLIAMDASLLEHGVTSRSAVIEAFGALRERCQAFGGEFSLLWHNNRLESRRDRRLYSALLES